MWLLLAVVGLVVVGGWVGRRFNFIPKINIDYIEIFL